MKFLVNLFSTLFIRGKIALLYALLVVGIIITVLYYLPALRAGQLEKALSARMELIAKVISVYIAEPLEKKEFENIQEKLNHFKELKEISYFLVFDSSGALCAEISYTDAMKYKYSDLSAPLDEENGILKFSLPLYNGKTPVGTIYMAQSTSIIEDEINELRLNIAVIGGIIVIGGIVIILVVSSVVITPIRSVIENVQKIAAGNLDIRIPVYFPDETGMLANSINEMVTKLQQTSQKNDELTKNLEERVRERTNALLTEIADHKRTEEALWRSRQDLMREQKIFMGGPTVVIRWLAVPELRVEYVSSNIKQFGYSREEFEDSIDSYYALVHPDDRTRIKQEVASNTSQDISQFELYYRIIKKSGEERYVYHFINVVRGAENIITHFDGYLIDITEGKHAEYLLTQSEHRLRAIFEKAGIGIVITDLSGKIIDSNESFLKMLQYSADEMTKKTLIEISHPDDRQDIIFLNSAEEGSTPQKAFTFEKRYISKSHSIVWGKGTSTFIQDLEASRSLAVWMIEDVTQRKTSEDLVLKLNKIVKGVAESVTSLITSSNYKRSLQEAIRLLGESSSADRCYIFENSVDQETGEYLLSQRYEWSANGVPPEIDNPHLQNLPYFPLYARWFRELNNGRSIKGSIALFPESEKILLVEQGIISILVVPIFVTGRFWGFIGFDSCQTERIWTEAEESVLRMAAASFGGIIEREEKNKEIVLAVEKAVESDRLKSTLLSNMSHEFRTPMNGILGYAELLTDELSESNLKEMASNIIHSGRRLMATLDTILDLSQLESNKIIPVMKPLSLSVVLKPILPKYSAMAKAKNLHFEYIPPRSPVIIDADANLLQKIVSHLADNAIKFTSSGGITISVGSEKVGEHRYNAFIKVKDTGIGISEKNHSIIFEEFRQVSEGMGRSYEGSGLGLSVAKRIATLMRGSISVESQSGVGSVFTVTFPAVVPEAEFEIEESQNVTDIDDTEFPVDKLYKVLLVEDQIINRDITRLFLKNLCIVEFAETGELAVELAEKEKFDFILMDIQLGAGIDGIEATQRIRKLPGYHNTPIAALTGYAMEGDREKFIEAGLTHYLKKPFSKITLRNFIKQLIIETKGK